MSEIIVNTGNTAGAQVQPQITQLTNGNILVAWTDYSNNVDGNFGTEALQALEVKIALLGIVQLLCWERYWMQVI